MGEGGRMFRWGMILGLLGALVFVANATAQVPKAPPGLKYQVVGPSTSPLSAPIPAPNVMQKKPSFFARVYDTLLKFVPFVPAKNPSLAPPVPTSQKLPNAGPGVQIQQTGSGIPIPQTPRPQR
jgi:hypothetical protein